MSQNLQLYMCKNIILHAAPPPIDSMHADALLDSILGHILALKWSSSMNY